MHIENMSITAHRITKIEYAPDPTFDCWYDGGILEFLLDGDESHAEFTMDAVGVFEVNIKRLKEALASPDLTLGDEVRKALEADIAWAKSREKNYISYDCF
jgi:hypothetical protein